MKKFLTGILAFAFVLASFAPPTLAEETPAPDPLSAEAAESASSPAADETPLQIVQLTIDTVTAASGGEAKVALSIANGNGVDSLECNINYNPNALKITRIEPGVTFPAEYCIPNANEAGRVRLATACALGLDNEQGTVIILHCKLTGDAGSAITLSDVRVTTVGAEYVQSKAYVGITDGGVTVGNGPLPQSAVTPWIPETPIPPATPTPEPTAPPEPEVYVTPAPSATPEPEPEPEQPSMLPYVIAGVIAVLLAAGIVILLVSSSNHKKKSKRKKKSAGKPRK